MGTPSAMASTARRTWELENQVVQVHWGLILKPPKHSTDNSTDDQTCRDSDDDNTMSLCNIM